MNGICQCHYLRASVLLRVGAYECIHFCVYTSVYIYTFSNKNLEKTRRWQKNRFEEKPGFWWSGNLRSLNGIDDTDQKCLPNSSMISNVILFVHVSSRSASPSKVVHASHKWQPILFDPPARIPSETGVIEQNWEKSSNVSSFFEMTMRCFQRSLQRPFHCKSAGNTSTDPGRLPYEVLK